MKVKFKGNTEPCIEYNVLQSDVMEYSEKLCKWCPHLELEVLGLVPAELLAPAKDHPDNIPAINIAIELSQ